MSRQRAFTLIEVLVALAIFAVVAASVLTASARSLQIAARLEDKTLAMWIADNRLTELQLRDAPPGNGRDQGELEYGGRRWEWLSQVEGTRDPALRRVTLWVAVKPSRGAGTRLEERATVRLVGSVESSP